MLKMLEDGNKASGRLGKPKVFFGLIGTFFGFANCSDSQRIIGSVLFFFVRFCAIHCRMVHDTHHQAIASRPSGRSLRLSLRGDGSAHHTVESQD
jgi:hypothetical protein